MAHFSSRFARLTGAAVLALSLAACGGGGDGGGDTGTPVIPVQPVEPIEPIEPVKPVEPVQPLPIGQGELKSSALLGTLARSEISAALAESDLGNLGGQGLESRYAVTSYRLEYLTLDAQGQSVRASGLVSVPVKAPGAASPVLSYQHGTIFRDAEAPSNHAVASEASIILASMGYIVLAPDYVGYGVSKGKPHPYLLSAPTAAAVVDFLTAAKTWRYQNGVADNQQLFMTGYSEGGYATMAAHRAMQTDNSAHLPQLQGVVTGAGPYDVQATMNNFVDLVRKESPFLGGLISPGFLRYLGGTTQNEVRRALLREIMPADADTVLDTQFLDNFLADDTSNIARVSSVHDWRPQLPVLLFHGRDDTTVPYASSTSTLAAMQAQGAGDRVSLTDCTATPSSHLGCVPPFINFMLGKLALVARNL